MTGSLVDGTWDRSRRDPLLPAAHAVSTAPPTEAAGVAEPTLFPGVAGTGPLRDAVDRGMAHMQVERDGSLLHELPAPRHEPARATSGVLVDLAGLAAAVVITAITHGLHAHAAHQLGRQAFFGTLLEMAVCLPVFVVALSTSRRPVGWRLHTTLGQAVHEVGLPLCAAGLTCLMVWRLAQLVVHLPSAPFDAVMLTCGLSMASVAGARLANQLPPRRHGRRARRVVIVGTGVVAERMRTQLEAMAAVHVVGFVDDDPMDPAHCLGRLDDLSWVCEREAVDHVVVAFSRSDPEHMIDALRPVQGTLPITVVPRLFDVVPMSANVQELAYGFPGISVAPGTLDRWQRAVKRGADVVGAGLGLLALSPLLVVMAMAVRVSSPGPVIIRQPRVGREGRTFAMFKFRTMRVEGDVPPAAGAGGLSDDDGPAAEAYGEAALGPFPKLKCDPRVTRVGGVLRRASVDELPQLVNVLVGQMSLVGPRPFMLEDAARIGGWALRRYTVRPGITGLWQVSGRNDLTYDEMCRLDHLYVTCWSLGLDARILLRTIRAVSAGRGAY
ncbi:MAG TPA: exopolysaccharide biosynthesis polyprenyl glycosylphosphotransferase [Acidimicrobiales bacterium]|nr:exopolysaccharide biosynthesis polyprenyl glycosylphosphotransferase [Acidimicrobiales bacterium]